MARRRGNIGEGKEVEGCEIVNFARRMTAIYDNCTASL